MAGHDVQYGKHRTRRSFSRIKEVLDLPNLIEIQTDSFKAFLDHGLKEVFEDVLPISNFTDTMELEFVGYEIKEPKYTLEEARIHDASYSAPIFVTFRLINKETGEIKTQEVFFGDFPIMTEMGTFIINGGERIIVSQLVRSPGVYFNDKVDKNGKVGYGSTVIPNRGAWLELESDSKDITYTRIDRTRKIPFTTLVRALGFSGDDEIFDIFGDSELVRNTVEKDIHKNPMDSRTDEALKEIYERLRPGEPKTENRFQHLEEMRRMGLHSEIIRDTARIVGGQPLQGAEVLSTDLRASAALILTGLVAQGETVVGKLVHLDRGYYGFHEKLAQLGAKIQRIEASDEDE
ncbi:DNA-directed RNA polymerase subunit beta [Streptococcus pneumoniae]|nr:DNA-directed RNA polymerase subunit beta [Streptococcus pneumoniae]